MHFILLLIIPTVLLVLLGCITKPGTMDPATNKDKTGDEVNDSIKKWTRAELQEKLEQLGKTPVPEDSITFGAMCYAMAYKKPGNDRTSFDCPSCGSSTYYKEGEKGYNLIAYLKPQCETQLKEIRGLEIKLDQTRLCSKCNKLDDPSLGLRVRYSDEREDVVTYGIGTEDIQIIQEFLAGRLTHTTSNDGRTPLIENKIRLEELLGIKVE